MNLLENMDAEDLEQLYRLSKLAAMNFPWESYVGDSGDEVKPVEEVYPKKLDPKDMSVKSDTEEDQKKLWDAVVDYGRSS